VKITKNRSGVASYVGLAIMIIIFTVMLMIVIVVTPVFTIKQNLDTFAGELVRTAEIYGEIGAETDVRTVELRNQFGISPNIVWNRSGRVPLGEKITVTLTLDRRLEFSTFTQPEITLGARASGRSEVYWK
jgi:hypothetical protein